MTSTSPRLPLQHLIAAAAAAAVGLGPAMAQGTVTQFGETVLASGDPAPGFPAGATVAVGFTTLGAAMDRNGDLLFRARVNQNSALGIDNTNDGGLYLGRSYGDLRLVLRTGSQAPGCAAGTLLRNNTTTPSNGLGTNPRLSPAGSVLFFRSALFDPVTPANTPSNANTALFWGPPNGIQLLAREGDLVPFLANGERYGDIVFTHQGDVINAGGAVVFAHSLVTGGTVTTGNDSLLAFGVPGNLQLIAREGSAWSGSGNGELLGQIPALAQLNEAGVVLHEVQFTLGSGTVPVTAADNRALALWLGGVDVSLLREGDQAPGLPAGVRFADESTTLSFVRFSNCSLNSGGTTAVRVYLAGGGTTIGVDDTAVYLATPSALTKVFRRGEAAPTLPAGILFGDVTGDSLGLDAQGRIVCTTSLQGAVTPNDDSAVWFGPANNLRVLAREGDIAPGLVPSVNGPWRFSELFGNVRPAINGAGAVIMPAAVGDGVATRVAWFSYLPDGRSQVLLDGGESWTTPLGTSPIATTQFISPAGGGDSSPTWFNNQADFTFVATMQVTTVNPGTAIVRARVGSLQAVPAAIPATGGVQSWSLDAGPGQPFGLYVVLGTQSDTRPGLAFGGNSIPLNPDPWFSLTLTTANSAVYSNSLGLLDAQGRASAAFVYPPGFAAFAGSTFHHAFVVLDANLQLPFVSEPSGLKLF